MNILILNQHIQDVVGGSEAQCDLIAKYLTQFGHHVLYFAINGQQSPIILRILWNHGPLTWRELRRMVSTHQPDIVYWRFNKRRLLPSVLLLKLLGKKVVFAISHINDVKNGRTKSDTTQVLPGPGYVHGHALFVRRFPVGSIIWGWLLLTGLCPITVST